MSATVGAALRPRARGFQGVTRAIVAPAASIATSWLWGLGMFFSLHITALYGLDGLLLFAVPNALGLALFGFILSARRTTTTLRQLAEQTIDRFPWLFAGYQITAVSLTLFALTAYVFAAVGLPTPLFLSVSVLLLAILVADRLGLRRLFKLHLLLFLAMIPLYVVIQSILPAHVAVLSGSQPHDGTFAALFVPIVLGLLFGPWLDLQQWQRAVAIEEQGGSVAAGFALAATFFLVLLIANGLLLLAVDPARLPAPDALPFALDAGGLLVAEVAARHGGLAAGLVVLWCLAGLFTTLDSSRLAIGWMMSTLALRGRSALLSLLPEPLLTSTGPFFLVAIFLAGASFVAGLTLQHFMVVFATLFLAYSVVIARGIGTGVQVDTQDVLVIGLLSLCLLAAGYLGGEPAIVAVAPVVALFSLVLSRRVAAVGAIGTSPQTMAADTMAARREPTANTMPDRRVNGYDGAHLSLLPAIAHGEAPADDATDGWFDDRWFNIKVMPTYGDTNSVGNVYFANHLGWIGKVRELFFLKCMPDFDLKTTSFYILTRNISHKFVREVREFQEILVRVRVGTLNRKFVKLEHEIRDAGGKLIGQGEQTLMFVRSDDYGLVDVPGPVITSFTNRMPTEHLRGIV